VPETFFIGFEQIIQEARWIHLVQFSSKIAYCHQEQSQGFYTK